MPLASFEGVVEAGRICLSASVHLPEKTKVYVVVPDTGTEVSLDDNPGSVRREETPSSEAMYQKELRERSLRLFREADSQVREPADVMPDGDKKIWTQGVEEKARRMGLKL